jgi:hypothetical protein
VSRLLRRSRRQRDAARAAQAAAMHAAASKSAVIEHASPRLVPSSPPVPHKRR